ncbi:MAG: LamG domain-containing protein [Pseudomonadales bacterium]
MRMAFADRHLHKLALTLLLTVCPAWAAAAPCDAYFPFDGDLNDASGNGYHGLMTAEGAPPAPRFAAGRNGQALHVQSGAAMHAFIDLHYDFCPQVTVTAWFRLPSLSASGNQYLFSTGGGVGPGAYVQDGSLRIEGTGNGIYYRDAVGSADTWYFIAVTYDYVNGTYALTWRNRTVSEDMGSIDYDVENAFWIGTYNDNLSYTAQDLLVDDLRIHGRVLSADDIRALAAGTAPAASTLSAEPVSTTTPLPDTLGPRLTSLPGTERALPACETHQDCAAGSYCAWDGTCHPERHAPRQTLSFQPVQSDLAGNVLLPEVTPAEAEAEPASTPAASSGPYGTGNPSFTMVAGRVGDSQRRIDLGEEFLTRIRVRRDGDTRGPCRIWANDTDLDLCRGTPASEQETISVQLDGSVIGRLSVCSIGTVAGLHVWGDVIDADGSTRYEPAASQDEFPNCRGFEATVGEAWSSSMLCASNQLATGLVVHSNDIGPYEVITGLQLICRRIAVR